MNQNTPTMLTIKEAAARTGLSYRCVRNLCLDGKVVHIMSGNKTYVNYDKLIDYLNGKEVMPDGR